MSSEEILVDMSRQIGEISGKLTEVAAGQKLTNEALFTMVKDHEERLKDVESSKNKVIGAVIASGFSGSGIGAMLAKIFGAGTGHGP